MKYAGLIFFKNYSIQGEEALTAVPIPLEDNSNLVKLEEKSNGK